MSFLSFFKNCRHKEIWCRDILRRVTLACNVTKLGVFSRLSEVTEVEATLR